MCTARCGGTAWVGGSADRGGQSKTTHIVRSKYQDRALPYQRPERERQNVRLMGKGMVFFGKKVYYMKEQKILENI